MPCEVASDAGRRRTRATSDGSTRFDVRRPRSSNVRKIGPSVPPEVEPPLERGDGAKVGAHRGKPGRVELASGTTRVVLCTGDPNMKALLRGAKIFDVERHELSPPKRPRKPQEDQCGQTDEACQGKSG